MRTLMWMGAALSVAVAAASCAAEEKGPLCDLKVGDNVGAFQVVKAGGAEDGVKVGETLCYLWKLGKRPVVMVFTRKIDDGLASLVKKLDAVVAENAEKEMFAFVNFVGEDAEALQKAAAEFGKKHETANTALVVPKDHADGPKRYGIAAKTSLVVALYSGKQVKVLHALAEGQLNKKLIAAIVADTAKILIEEEEPKQDEQPDKEKKKDRKKKAEKKEEKEA